MVILFLPLACQSARKAFALHQGIPDASQNGIRKKKCDFIIRVLWYNDFVDRKGDSRQMQDKLGVELHSGYEQKCFGLWSTLLRFSTLSAKKTEFIMSETKKGCELCGLPVQTRGFKLITKDGEKMFCCEGCKSIYRLLYQDSIPPRLK